MASEPHSVDPKRTKQVNDLIAASCDVVIPPGGLDGEGTPSKKKNVVAPAQRSSWPTFQSFKRVIGAGDEPTRGFIQILEDDIVSQNYHNLRPIQLVESGPNLPDKKSPGDVGLIQAFLGIVLLFVALGIASAPLFDSSIDAESLMDNSGILVKKNASYAKAYYLGAGFFTTFVKQMKNNVTSLNWYPQTTDTKFLNYPFLVQSAFTAYGSGPSDGKKVTILPDSKDWRVMSGPFAPSKVGPTNQRFDVMGLPGPVRDRMFYMVGKADSRQGLTLPTVKRQSFDRLIAQNTYGSTIADMMEISSGFSGSKHSYFTLYRIAGAMMTLPRLQFTFAVAGQSLALLAFMFGLAMRNGALNSYHLIHQILRLPTFCIISIQLLYVLYYQIFSIGYVSNNPTLIDIYNKKIIYVAGVSYILLHQLDVRAAVTLWPRMANNDSYYFTRILWMISSLGVMIWSLKVKDPAHYVVATSSTCALGASECNKTDDFFFQHWWRRDRSEYSPRDYRHPDYLTSFEAYGCGGPLSDSYYYNTLVTRELPPWKGEDEPNYRTLQYLTCAKAVRDEGFMMLGGCYTLIRAKDIHVIMITKLLPRSLADNINMSGVVAHIQDHRLAPMRRVSYMSLWCVARRWDGRNSYPDIG